MIGARSGRCRLISRAGGEREAIKKAVAGARGRRAVQDTASSRIRNLIAAAEQQFRNNIKINKCLQLTLHFCLFFL